MPVMIFRVILLSVFIPAFSRAEEIKPPPRQWLDKPHVVVEWQEILEDCHESLICVEGGLFNDGGQTALDVHLRIELGGTEYIKPRLTLTKRVGQAIMNPGDRQDFYVEIDRKIPTRRRGKSKVFEVGLYNYKIVPDWAKKGRLTFQ